MASNPILLATYGGGHVNVVIPVYHELVRRGLAVRMLGLTMAQDKLRQAGIPFLGITDFLEPADEPALALGERMVRSMEPNPLVPHAETVAYMGLSYQELIDDHGAERAAQLYESAGRQCFLPRKLARRILAALSPSQVVTTNSPRMEHALLLEADAAGTPSYCVSDFWAFDRGVGPGYGDVVFVPFDANKQRLVAAGRRPEEVVVSGAPSLDYLAEKDAVASRNHVRSQKGWEGKRVILLVKSVLPLLASSEDRAQSYLKATFDGRDDTIVVLRPHPNDPGDYSKLITENIVVSPTNEPLWDVLTASDTIVTVNSTVGMEANLLGRQVIQLNMVEFASRIPFAALGIGHEVTSISGLDEALTGSEQLGLLPPCMAVGSASSCVVDHIIADMGG